MIMVFYIVIFIIIIVVFIIIMIIRENVAVVNVFLNAPQTQILDVNEKTSIIDAVKIVIMTMSFIKTIFLIQTQIVMMMIL